ncbi:MAG: hypothetical protein M3319_07895 [Actinomycetota bacterium]|nr:hypothetical protein [Actinomycetota bacterium]
MEPGVHVGARSGTDLAEDSRRSAAPDSGPAGMRDTAVVGFAAVGPGRDPTADLSAASLPAV